MSKTRRILLASVSAGVALALGAYWVGRTSGGRTTAEDRSNPGEEHLGDGEDERGARLERAVARLERRLAALEARVVLAPPAPTRESSPNPAPEGPAVEKGLDAQKEDERRQERATAIELALRTERRDATWSSATEGHVRATVDAAVSEGGKFAVKELSCVTSLCELVLSAATADDLKYLPDQLAPRFTGMSSIELSAPVTGADGRATVTLRLFRQGYPRPDEGVL